MLCFCVRQFILIEPLITWASKLEVTRVLPVSLDRMPAHLLSGISSYLPEPQTGNGFKGLEYCGLQFHYLESSTGYLSKQEVLNITLVLTICSLKICC